MPKTNVAQPKRRSTPKDVVVADQRLISRRMDNSSNQRVIVERRLTSVGTVSTNGSGYIAAAQVTSDGARSANGFSSFSGRYSQFRVKSIRITLIPVVDVTTAVTAGGGAVTPHPSALAFAKFMEGAGYVNIAALADGAEFRLFNGREPKISYGVDWENVPEAKLWSACSGAIPTAQLYGLQYQDFANGPASSATTVYYRAMTEYLVQFTNPQ